MKHILVTGATGFIGYELSRQLCRDGYRPRLMVRRPVRGMLLNSLDAELRQGDLSSPRSIQRLLGGIDTVIHLGAMATFESYRKVRPSIVDGSMNLIRAAVENGVERFVYGGSLLIYDNQVEPIDQSTVPHPLSGYGRAKLEAETRMAEAARKAGMRFTSLRLPHVYGAMSLLFFQIRRGRIFFPGRGDNQCGHLHVADAARALIKAAGSDREGIYVIGDELSCSWNEFFEVTRMYYPRLKIFRVPKWLSLIGTGVIETALSFKKTPNHFSTGAVKSWNLHLPVEPGTLKRVLGMQPLYPTVSEGIPQALDDCIALTWRPSNQDS